MTGTPRRIPTYVVLPARTLLLDVAGPIEALRGANQLQDGVRFDVRYVGALPEVTTSIGLRITGITTACRTNRATRTRCCTTAFGGATSVGSWRPKTPRPT